MAKVVIALGGNALGNSPSEQKQAVKETAIAIVELSKQGHRVIVCHGNGPQVGMINNSFSSAFKAGLIKEVMPFAECGSMSQGYIGWHLQNAILNEFKKQGIKKNVLTVVTQTLVDINDPAFKKPSKPVGEFMDKTIADNLAKKNDWTIIEDSGRGWRRVVPSPKPIDVIEKNAINDLLDNDYIVIAGGGGGVPVYDSGDIKGIDAVIDKDFTSAKLAELTSADAFIVLTAVPRVMINFGQDNQSALEEVSCSELEKHIKDNQFAPGSMLPKVEAAMSFVSKTGKAAYIGELKDAIKIIAGTAGTKITK